MNSAKYTPGPWQAGLSDDGYFIGNGEWPDVCQKIMRRNDARLIAAAPDLLEALKRMLAWAADVHAPGAARINYSGMDAARAAIAKATGESK